MSAWLGWIAVASAFLAMTVLSWRRWGDTQVDLGFQLYMPWQITQGKDLYLDGTSLFGPWSQYFHALQFHVFGTSLTTVIVTSLFLLAGYLLFVHVLFAEASDRLTATAIGLVVVLGFAFAHYVPNGNYNYILPYSFEAVHGLYAGTAAIAFLWIWIERRALRHANLTGFCIGLVFLTKPEIFLATITATAFGIFLLLPASGDRRFLAKSLVRLIGFFSLPILLCGLYFIIRAGGTEGLRVTFAHWTALWKTSAVSNPFYLKNLGLDEPLDNTALMLKQCAGASLFGAACFFFCRWEDTMGPFRRLLAVVYPLAVVLLSFGLDWLDFGRVLPLLNAFIVLHLAWTWKHANPSDRPPLSFPLLWSVFAGVLLLKMGVNSRIWHYGFVLAMPSTVAVVYYLGWFLPDSLRRFRIHVPLFRGTVLAALAVGLFLLTSVSLSFYREKTYAVGREGDTILTFPEEMDPTGPALNRTLEWIEQHVPTDATLAVLPEGILINYLSRRSNPTKFHSALMVRISGEPSGDLGRQSWTPKGLTG